MKIQYSSRRQDEQIIFDAFWKFSTKLSNEINVTAVEIFLVEIREIVINDEVVRAVAKFQCIIHRLQRAEVGSVDVKTADRAPCVLCSVVFAIIICRGGSTRMADKKKTRQCIVFLENKTPSNTIAVMATPHCARGRASFIDARHVLLTNGVHTF